MLQASSALLAGSLTTLREIPARLHDKCIYLPENGFDPARFSRSAAPAQAGLVRACFVGRLVPLKGVDMLLAAAAPELRRGRLHLDLIGDGPLMGALRDSVAREGLGESVTFHGWVRHADLQSLMSRSQVLLFPSVREFGGGVVLEAMALGVVPVV